MLREPHATLANIEHCNNVLQEHSPNGVEAFWESVTSEGGSKTSCEARSALISDAEVGRQHVSRSHGESLICNVERELWSSSVTSCGIDYRSSFSIFPDLGPGRLRLLMTYFVDLACTSLEGRCNPVS